MLLPPDEPFHNSRALKSVDDFYLVQERRVTDYKAQKFGNSLSEDSNFKI